MTAKQKAKHITDSAAQILHAHSCLSPADPTPDGLGEWRGGTQALKSSNRWVAEKSHSNCTGDAKNTPGIDYASKITHRQDADFNEIHTDANGEFFLYNVKTDAWDIKGDPAYIPYCFDGEDLWGYNVKTGAWDISVSEEVYEEYPEYYVDADDPEEIE
jgi:hypothetical protein